MLYLTHTFPPHLITRIHQNGIDMSMVRSLVDVFTELEKWI